MTPSLTSPVKSGVRVSSGPLIAYIASYRAKLESLGYVPTQVVYHLRFFAKLDLWLLRRKQRLRWLNEEKVGQFLAQLTPSPTTVLRKSQAPIRRVPPASQ